MSYRRMMHITLLLLLLSLAGCATFSGGDSPEERQKAEMTKDDLWNRTKALEKEKAAAQKRLADQQEEIARMAKDLSDQQNEIARANKQVSELNKSVDELTTQMRQLQEARQREHPLKEIDLTQPKKETERTAAAEETGSAQVKMGTLTEDRSAAAPKQIAREEPAETQSPQQKNLTIKVLSGDGDLASARSLSNRLGKMGYRVKLIDKAPRSDFNGIVVYYGNEHRASAETMAKRLGGGTVTRPLTWSSAFNIIVVTGRQP
jgi:vacuolar-type H+-ATPase subunit I/STV1